MSLPTKEEEKPTNLLQKCSVALDGWNVYKPYVSCTPRMHCHASDILCQLRMMTPWKSICSKQ